MAPTVGNDIESGAGVRGSPLLTAPPSSQDYQSHLKSRFCCEYRIFRARMVEFIFLAVFIIYFNTDLFRTLGFVRHRQIVDYIPDEWCAAIASSPLRPEGWKDGDSCLEHFKELKNNGSLKDALHDLLPDKEDDKLMKLLPEAIQGVSVIAVACMFICGSLFRRPSSLGRRPLLANILTRGLRNLSIVFGLRPLLFLATSLPGPNAKCRGPVEEEIRPNVWQAFSDLSLGGANCGDLMFSGHMASLTVLACCFFYYGRELLHPQVYLYRAGCVFLALLLVTQPLFIAMARNHYTADMVAAVIISLLCWRLYHHEIGPDPSPAHFLPEYEAAMRSDDPQTQEKLNSLDALDDRSFAEHVQGQGTFMGGAMMFAVCAAFLGVIFMTFKSLVSG